MSSRDPAKPGGPGRHSGKHAAKRVSKDALTLAEAEARAAEAAADLARARAELLKAQQDADSAFGTAADLAGTATAFATAVAADGMAVLDIYQPQERYVRPVLTVGNFGTARPAMILAIQYGAKVMPQSNVGEFHQSPAEGTA